jgi:sarcosine oxidase
VTALVYDAIVVGVGSMGSAALYQLAARGANVLGLEQFDVPNTLGASLGTNRIIRLAYSEHPDYVPLLHRAYALWREIEKLAAEPLLVITGGVDVGTPESWTVTGSLRACDEHGLAHEVLDARAMAQRFPAYRLASDMVAVYQPQGGYVMSERSVAVYALAALDAGAEIHGREQVLRWEPRGDEVQVTTTAGQYVTRRLVLCAGPWTGQLLPDVAKLAVAERQVLLWTQPKAPALFKPDRFPVFNMEAPEGRFYGFPIAGVPGFKIGRYHHLAEAVDPNLVERACDARDEAVMREGIRRYFPDADGPTLAMKACMFTNSPDEHFIIDRHPASPHVFLAAGFSGHGFKFCSVIGEVLADLALKGGTAFNIDLFRLDRPALQRR